MKISLAGHRTNNLTQGAQDLEKDWGLSLMGERVLLARVFFFCYKKKKWLNLDFRPILCTLDTVWCGVTHNLGGTGVAVKCKFNLGSSNPVPTERPNYCLIIATFLFNVLCSVYAQFLFMHM